MLVRPRVRYPEPRAMLRTPGPGDLALRPGWLLQVLFLGIFVWWALGISGFIQPIVAVPMLFFLLVRGRDIAMPRAFLLWILFLFWVLISEAQIKDFARLASAAWRTAIYVAAGLVFLYIYNQTRGRLTTAKLVKTMALFWGLVVIGGVIGMVLPTLSFRTVTESVLPASVVSDRFVNDMVHASTASPRAFSFTSVHRPKAPFFYTNQWGSAYALTLPFAIAALPLLRSRLWKRVLLGTLVLSVFPLVFSLDRGAWLSASASMAYAMVRLAMGGERRHVRTATMLLFIGVVSFAIVLVTPLWGLIQLRLDKGYGDETREILYESAIDAVRLSPLLGFGAPIAQAQVNPRGEAVSLSVGTHGQFWTVLVSHGIPGLLFFLGWWGVAFVRTGRLIPRVGGRDPNSRFWCHVAILAGLIQMPYYQLVPWGLPIMMVAAAIGLREARPDVSAPRLARASYAV
jgi:O-antigen ligase